MSDQQMTRDSITYAPAKLPANVQRDHRGQWQSLVEYSQPRKILEATLRRVVAQDKADRLRRACERLLDMAVDDPDPRNAMAAFTIIADRLDGKAVARIETSDGDARSLSLAEIVHAVLQARASTASDAEPTQEQIPPGV